ncbi:nicotinate phosphoribosyltransferase [Candidatus Riesia sp. GBBU]|nr:nicotinate phosphoribosyltransferase [Candidatus Riesia sp. GBBU]
MSLKEHNFPIIKSILDTDAYKLHMQQAVFHKYDKVSVVATLNCREKESLIDYIDYIKDQIKFMEKLLLKEDEYFFLKKFPFFSLDYLDWLKNFRFDSSQIKIKKVNGEVSLKIYGNWRDVILWEVPILSLVSEIINKNQFPKIKRRDAINQLKNSIDNFYFDAKIKKIDLENFRLIDFGTRRRFSKDIQYCIIKELKDNFPYFIGTSNYYFAKKLDLQSFGTQSHEWFQAHQRIIKNLKNSQKKALKVWLDEYPNQLKIAVTDCINMDSFLRDFDYELSNLYQGLRHDSGDPVSWGEKAICHYKKFSIDPMKKTLIFSDNLNLKKALMLYNHFYKRINTIFGIGTNLTCNIPDVKPLNIVIKLTECNGKSVAKLSDNPEKTVCNDNKFIHLLKKVFKVF